MTLALAPDLVTTMGQSAVRSLLLGALVLTILRLVRLRDLRAETAIWTAVLAAALAMPLLARVLPGMSVSLPAIPHPSSAPAALAVPSAEPRLTLPAPGLVLTIVYVIGVSVGLARILAGLALVTALYHRARPVPEPWALGKAIRVSEAVSGPLSFARCILLPADYRTWPQTKLAAVLAHEECHIRRGDFFIQLLASLHRALFWFSPFPWWLQRKLGELAETASDAAGARRIGDAASYAEILIDVTRAAHMRRRRLSPAPALAMAHGPALAVRVDHVLAAPPERILGAGSRTLALTAVAAASLGLAAVHAAFAQGAATAQTPPAAFSPGSRSSAPEAASRRVPPATRRTRPSTRHKALAAARPPAAAPPAQPAAADETSYDPLALLEDSTAAVVPAVILARGRIGPVAHD